MKFIDATPPAGFPLQVVVAQPREVSARHPDAGYWLRVTIDGGAVDAIQLPGAVAPCHARRLARGLGYEPTHYTDPGYGRPWLF